MSNQDIYPFTNFVDLSSTSCSSHKKQPFKRVAVEGNIGCGKTTFLEYFKSHTDVEIIAEPVEKWKDVNGFNCFEMMYRDAKRWSLAFQSFVALTMMENHEQEQKQGYVKIIERSVYSARYCFIENLHQRNVMSDIEYAVLNMWHDWIANNTSTGLDLIVYLRASPEICFKRLKLRSRSEESSVSLEYLQDLHALHEDWLIHKKQGFLPAPVMVIDVDQDLHEVTKKLEKLTPLILSLNQS